MARIASLKEEQELTAEDGEAAVARFVLAVCLLSEQLESATLAHFSSLCWLRTVQRRSSHIEELLLVVFAATRLRFLSQ